MPGADSNIGGSSGPRSALLSGLGTLCVVLFIAILVAAGFFTCARNLKLLVTSPNNSPYASSVPDPEGDALSLSKRVK
jgi:hypothetical protein